ncbi:hypothetical protein KUTeg_020410 [Tegillarca granosa]|uniref:EGF-like domain-containing protein n=1 Tax=Tegillarca granosa TaxID=220873 RepID=A0ABQ9EDT4_TEGGR|nr:hypothetical protein KUTeg_020410 [Tegillarca granosa]
MMGIILKFLFYFGYLLTTSYGMTTLTCTQHNTQVQSNTTCVAYLLTKENCSRIALPTIFPNLYKHIHNQLYPEKPSNFTVVPIEYQSTVTASIVHIPGFEVNVVSVDRGSRACVIIDFNGTLTAPDIHSKFKVTLKKLLGLYYLDAYNYADQQSGQWSTTISYQLMTSQRAIRMWFVAPPPQYNFTEFEVELYSYDNNRNPKEKILFLVRISQLTYTFLNISDGNYIIKGEICNSTSNCRGDLGLSCIKNHCKCEGDHYWSGTKCLPKLGYGNTCSSTMECESADGLLCIQGQCQCNDSYYWSDINKGCTTKMHYNGACIIGEDGCQSSLVCSDSGKCQCKDKIWSEEDGKCVEQYITSIQILAVVGGCLCGIILLVVMGLFVYFRYRRPREKKRARNFKFLVSIFTLF